ncbi:MAG TPA: KpsF/GutQ family sugar-phosphate isomerase, partial [Verrucomicrobiota bacterium]|nr:KpsF/GutQ family sugar-phosphate isomerase [Verrucomicrobiota bacterium]
MTHRARARRVLDLELAALRAVRGRLDGSFDVAVERVLACLAERGKLVLVGIGKSGHIAAKLAATFTSTYNSFVIGGKVN